MSFTQCCEHMTSLVGHVRYLSLIFDVLQDYLFKMVVMPTLASYTCAQLVPQGTQNASAESL